MRFVINTSINFFQTSLHYAVLQNQPEVVKALLMLGANPNICDEDNSTPLHVAVTCKTKKNFILLI